MRNKSQLFAALVLIILAFWTTAASSAQVYGIGELLSMADETSERIKMSEDDLAISGNTKDIALSVLYPRLSLFGSLTRFSEAKKSSSGILIQPDQSTAWGIRLDQSFSLSGRELIALDVAKLAIVKSRTDLRAVREDYHFRVVEAYIGVLRAKKTVDIGKANVDRLRQYRDATALRVKHGELITTFLLRAEAELSSATTDVVKANNNLMVAKTLLGRLAGISGEFDVKEFDADMILPVDLGSPDALDKLKSLAYENRPELKSLATLKDMSQGQVKFARGAYWPTVSVEGVFAKLDQSPVSQTFNDESVYAGVKLAFPLYEGGLRNAQVKEATLKSHQADLAFQDVKKAVGIDVETSYLSLMSQVQVLKSLEDQMGFAHKNSEAVAQLNEKGLANSLDVIDAYILLYNTETLRADAEYNYKLSVVRLARAAGISIRSFIDNTLKKEPK